MVETMWADHHNTGANSTNCIVDYPEPRPAENRPFQPVFVVGCERSGTTMLTVLLDRHPELAMTPETFFFQKVVPRKWKSREGDHDAMLERFFEWFMIKDLRLHPPQLQERFKKYPATYAELFRACLEEYAILHNKPRAGEKTPFHLWQVPLILQWFPDARIIGIVRDGRDVVLSILQMPWTTHQLVRLHCLKWMRAVKTAIAFERLYPRQFLLVKYEDILRGPHRMIRQIDHFAGLDYDPAQLRTGAETNVVIPRSIGFKADALRKLDPGKIGMWRHKATSRQRAIMNSTMGKLLRKMGYPDAGMAEFSPATRLFHGITDIACRIGVHRFYYNTLLRPGARRQRKDEGIFGP